MKRIGKIIALILCICIFSEHAVIHVYAGQSSEKLVSIRVSNGKHTNTYQVISVENEIYFAAEAYEDLTRYKCSIGENYGYKLGQKMIVVNPENGDIDIPALHYKGNIDKIFTIDGIDYFPASKLLPWMNVTCSVDDGTLTVVPDGISLWQILEDFEYNDYMFNLYEEYGDSVMSVTGLAAMTVFDTILNLRWDRLVSVDGTVTGAGMGGSLYDYKCYVAALSELGQIECLENDTVVDSMKDYVSNVKKLGTFEKVLGIDTEEIGYDLHELLISKGLDEISIQEILEIGDQWDDLRRCMDVPGIITKYADIFSAYRTYELILTTDDDYRDYIVWLSEKGTGNVLFDKALNEAQTILNEEQGAAYTLVSKFCGEILSVLPKEIFTAVANNTFNDTVLNAFAAYSSVTDFMGSIKTYTEVSNIIYSTLFKETVSGYEGMAKAGVLENIQDHCWNLAGTLLYDELTVEAITHIRQSYITALQAARQLFQSQQNTMNFGVLEDLGVLENGDDLLDSQMQLIDVKIQQLIASGDATLNDSADGKEEYKNELLKLFSNVQTYSGNGITEYMDFLQDHPEYNYYALLDINEDGIFELLATDWVNNDNTSTCNSVGLFVWKDDTISLAYEGLWSQYENLSYDLNNQWIHCRTGGTGASGELCVYLDEELNVQEETIDCYWDDDETENDIYYIYYNGENITETNREEYEAFLQKIESGTSMEIIFQSVEKPDEQYNIQNFTNEIINTYGAVSKGEFTSCISADVWDYSEKVSGYIADVCVDLDFDGMDERLVFLGDSQSTKIKMQVYREKGDKYLFSYEIPICDISYCMQQNVSLFYNQEENAYMLFVDASDSGAYTGYNHNFATVFKIGSDSILKYYICSDSDIVESELERFGVPYAINCAEIDNITSNVQYKEVFEIRHRYFNGDPLGGYWGREHHLQFVSSGICDWNNDEIQTWTITKRSNQAFTEYKEITYTKEWKTGTIHTVVPKWDANDDEGYLIMFYEVDMEARTIDIYMDSPEGSPSWESLVIDLKENTYYGEGYFAP